MLILNIIFIFVVILPFDSKTHALCGFDLLDTRRSELCLPVCCIPMKKSTQISTKYSVQTVRGSGPFRVESFWHREKIANSTIHVIKSNN